MAELKLIRPEDAAPVPGGQFTETETAAAILRCLHHVRGNAGFDLGLICGAPGVGKTEAVKHFVQTMPNVYLHTAVAAEGGAWNTANALSLRLGVPEPNNRDLAASRAHIGRRIGVGGVLIIDEAQYLAQWSPKHRPNWQTFEWLRTMSEDWGVGLVFCGDLSMCDMQKDLPQLWSRASPLTILRRPTKADVTAVAATWGIVAAKSVDLLDRLSGRDGLRGVDRVIRKAWVFAGDRAPSLEHLTASAEFFYPLQGAK